MTAKQYYCVTTRRFTLRCNQEEWLRITQELSNEVLLFYYLLFVDLEEKDLGSMTSLSAQQILRRLEVLTIVGRDKEPVPYPLPWVKIPLYFRRAAINEAAACAKSYFARIKAGKYAGKTKQFKKGVTFYKGMYRDITEKSVTLKIWNGVSWVWILCRINGNFIPAHAQPLSPSIFYDSSGSVLFLPVKTLVEDGRKAEERMRQGSRVCSFQFTNEDYFAIGVVLDEQGRQQAVRFFKGGREFAHRCAEILQKIQKSQQSMGMENSKDGSPESEEKYNQKHWTKYKHIRQYYAHLISRQIIDFCLEQKVAVILLPKYEEKYTKYVMLQTGKSAPLQLSRSIREQVFYKAWQVGMIVLEVNSKDTSNFCSVCGMPVKKKKEYYRCPNGHQGNKFLNSARNIGVKCLKSFGREMEVEVELKRG